MERLSTKTNNAMLTNNQGKFNRFNEQNTQIVSYRKHFLKNNHDLIEDQELLEFINEKKKAMQLYLQKKYKDALLLLTDLVDKIQEDYETQYYQALCLYQIGRLEEAEETLTRLIENPRVYHKELLQKVYILTLLKQEKYQEADICLKNIIKYSPNDLQYLNMHGFTLEQMNKVPEAIQVFKLVLKLDSFNANSCNSLAYCYYLKDIQLDLAFELVNKALRKEPENPKYLHTFAMIAAKQKKKVLAIQILKRAATISPNDHDIQVNLKELLQK